MVILPKPITFEWDKGNSDKNWIKHKIADKEREEPFFDQQKKIIEDVRHSENEQRFLLFGQTKLSRLVVIVFTIRHNRVRVISARNINKKEKTIYEKAS